METGQKSRTTSISQKSWTAPACDATRTITGGNGIYYGYIADTKVLRSCSDVSNVLCSRETSSGQYLDGSSQGFRLTGPGNSRCGKRGHSRRVLATEKARLIIARASRNIAYGTTRRHSSSLHAQRADAHSISMSPNVPSGR